MTAETGKVVATRHFYSNARITGRGTSIEVRVGKVLPADDPIVVASPQWFRPVEEPAKE